MSRKLRILILEDNAGDAALMEEAMRKAGLDFAVQMVQTRDDFLKAIADSAPDVVLADCNLPSFNGVEALSLFRQKYSDEPFIMVSGTVSDE